MTRVLIINAQKSIQTIFNKIVDNEGFESDYAADAETALMMLNRKPYHLIITDIVVSRRTGIDLIARIREISETVQIIVMTDESTVSSVARAIQYGVNDYLIKPFNTENFLKAIRRAEKNKLFQNEKADMQSKTQLYQRHLEAILLEKTIKLQIAMQGVISIMSSLVGSRDPYTAGHQRRVGNLSAAIAEKMKLQSPIVDLVRITGYIHDVGKIVIPIDILAKPGTLTLLEMQMIRNHCCSGYEILIKAGLPAIIGETIYQHHERCDGSGYPRGLDSGEISTEAKILMVADVVEAMISHRPYRPALGIEAAMREIEQNSGKLFDSEVVNSCIELFKRDSYKFDDREHIISFPI